MLELEVFVASNGVEVRVLSVLCTELIEVGSVLPSFFSTFAEVQLKPSQAKSTQLNSTQHNSTSSLLVWNL